MLFEYRTIYYYTSRIAVGPPFAFAGFSDAEWFCILGYDLGKTTGAGQILDASVGRLLLDVLDRRKCDSNFLVAVPSCMWTREDFVNAGIPDKIEKTLEEIGYCQAFYERDMVTDDLAAQARLYPLIHTLRSVDNITIIGNHALDRLDIFPTHRFIGVESPNLHLSPAEIDDVVNKVVSYATPGTYLISAGISSALIIDRLWDLIPDSSFIDCGSIWDAFVGIGGQREWRSRLYQDREAMSIWKTKNLRGYY